MNQRRLQPEWLESFLAVAEMGSFSAAAARLHSSQPRVSTHIAHLEASVRRSLIDRRRRPVVLTEAGLVMAQHARQVLRSLDEVADAFEAADGAVRGRVSLGTHPSISATYMPQLLTRLKRSAPGVSVELTERTTSALLTGLQDRSIDLAVRALATEPDRSVVVGLPIWRERYVAVFAGQNASRADPARPLQPSELAAQGLIVIAPPGTHVDSEFARAFAQWGVVPRVVARTEEPQTLLNMVRAGLGVGVINELAVAAFGSQGLLVKRVAGPGEGRVVALCWNNSRYLSRAMRVVAHTILTQPPPAGVALGSVLATMSGEVIDSEALMRAAAG